MFDLSRFKALADDEMNVTKKMKFVLGMVENILGKGWLPAFSPFPKMFSKASFINPFPYDKF